MELLRNYVQHRDLGVHTLTLDRSWIETDEEKKGKLRCRTTVLLDLDYLMIGGCLNNKQQGVIKELRDQPFQPDIPLLLREYVTALARIHKTVRLALKLKVDEWKAEVRQAISDYATAFPGVSVVGLCVMHRHADYTGTKLLDVFAEPIDCLDKVEQLNWCPADLSKTYVSSEYVPLKWKRK
jgi:hypothetical protein